MNKSLFRTSWTHSWVLLLLLAGLCFPVIAEEALQAQLSDEIETPIQDAVEAVKPALVRIHVVEPNYREGREVKYEGSGSGVVIDKAGYIITNHHVAGKARLMKCIFADKEEFEADLVGTDPLTDIAVIKIRNHQDRTFPVAQFGDSSQILVGESVMAMGSPRALSQSVTLGIISNTQMTLPERTRSLELDGEDVGTLVRWIAHDAEIHPGNSGGPLVNMQGEIIGINEIEMGLGGAIPGNLARDVAEALMERGQVKRAWVGVEVQPRLKSDDRDSGILVSGVLEDTPAEKAGFLSGDIIKEVHGAPIDVRFQEQLPDFNRLVSELPIGEPAAFLVERAGNHIQLEVKPVERERVEPRQHEMKPWGITVRDISFMRALELQRENTEGVLITSVRPGGPAGSARPSINQQDVLVAVNGDPVNSVQELNALTDKLLEGHTEPVPVMVTFDRKTDQYITVAEVGLTELQDPGLEVKRAWLPVETQVVTSDIAEILGDENLTGFRITRVYPRSTAAQAGLETGDVVLAVDGEKMTANAPEDYEELPALIRQYRSGMEVELRILRDGEEQTLPVELITAPKHAREMSKYQDENFEFTVREVTFFDRAEERWDEQQQGVLVEQIRSGSWAALARLSVGDLITEIDGTPIKDVVDVQEAMLHIEDIRPEAVVFTVKRGIHTLFIELEPKWDNI